MAILLLGNGINQNESLVCSWDDLLKTACKDDMKKRGKSAASPVLPAVDGLTMTLGFDLQEFYAIDHNIAKNGTDLKRKIASSMTDTMDARVKEAGFDWKDTIHYQIMHLPVDTVLTTNYDYALETSVCPGFKSCIGSRETVYSRYRKHTVVTGSGPQTVYHIHGEVHAPRSICLGFEQYSGSLEKMRSDLVRTTKNAEDPADEHTFHLQDVMLGVKKENGEDENDGAWYLRFFTDDIYILGLRLDFSEQDIWWLLDYRIRKMRYEKSVLSITNKICFFDTDAESRAHEGRYAARNDLLRAFGVEIIYLKGATYDEKYKKAVKRIRKELEAVAKLS